MVLDKTSFVPLYYQLADILRQQILNNSLQKGDLIPSENELMKQYGISRGTVREGIRLLSREGLLKRQRGVGTFVGFPKIEHDTAEVISFSRVLLSVGKKPSARVLEAKNVRPPSYVRDRLHLGAEEEATFIKRLRLGNGEALLLEHSFFRTDIGNNLLAEDLTFSIYKIIREKLCIQLCRSENTIEVSAADEGEAKLLGVPVGSPLMIFKRLVFSDADVPVEYAEDVYRGDRIAFKISAQLHDQEKNSKMEAFHK